MIPPKLLSHTLTNTNTNTNTNVDTNISNSNQPNIKLRLPEGGGGGHFQSKNLYCRFWPVISARLPKRMYFAEKLKRGNCDNNWFLTQLNTNELAKLGRCATG